MKLIGLARLGKTAELRNVGDTCVANLALAFNYGKKGEDGNRPTQWVEGSLWGKRAESLEQYLVKGQQVLVTLSETHIETYEGKNGTGSKLVGRIDDIEFAGPPPVSNAGEPRQGNNQRQAEPQQRQQQPRQEQRQPERSPGQRSNQQSPTRDQRSQQQPANGFEDMSDDIPF